jgi:hypothetical protein
MKNKDKYFPLLIFFTTKVLGLFYPFCWLTSYYFQFLPSTIKLRMNNKYISFGGGLCYDS